MIASTSRTPNTRAASATCSKIARASTRIRAPDLDLAEACRAGAVAGAHHLFRLPFAAIWHAPQSPMFAPCDRRTCVPELGRDAAVARVFQHADALAAADLPTDFAAELE